MDSNAEKARKLLEDQHLAVLCTQGDSGPYASLMAYTYDRETDAIWIVTRKDSEKHRNMMKNSRVALLLDDRCSGNQHSDGFISSLTVQGAVTPDGRSDAGTVHQRLGERFPPLKALLNDPESIILSITLDAYLLLEGPQKAVRGTFSNDVESS